MKLEELVGAKQKPQDDNWQETVSELGHLVISEVMEILHGMVFGDMLPEGIDNSFLDMIKSAKELAQSLSQNGTASEKIKLFNSRIKLEETPKGYILKETHPEVGTIWELHFIQKEGRG